MALPAGMADQEWKYFDFGANWDAFLAAWKTDAVQHVLYKDMVNWCNDHAFYEPDGSKPKWKRGEPLWKLSRTDYWDSRIMDAANEYIEQNDCVAKFKRTMENHGRRFADDNALHDAFYEVCMEHIYDDHSPKPDTIESLMLIHGGEFLYDALAETAKQMGLGEVFQAFDGLVLLPEKKLVFDHMKYYFDVVEGGSETLLLSDEDYEELLEDPLLDSDWERESVAASEA